MSFPSVPPAGQDMFLPPRSDTQPARFHSATHHWCACAALLAACVCCLAAPSKAQGVYWGTTSFATHKDSHGSPWGQRFRIELGIFQSPFSPTIENREQWSAHWIVLSQAAFDPEDARFAGFLDPTAISPAIAGRQVFVWAKDGDQPESGPEWLLISHPFWKIPAGTPAAPSPATAWITSAATQFIAGTPTPDGGSLVSEMIRPDAIPMHEWLASHFDETSSASLPADDPDGDGLCNLLEYALGTDPTCATSHRGPELRHHGGRISLSLARNPRADAGLLLETSTDLTHWTPVAGEWIKDRPNLLEADIPRDPAKTSAYFRVAVKPVEVTP